ncbi:MAG TPA: hypothetical protein VN915_10060, partial [Elusimicrobiota bacterium]|nr:hypothetical protein [Elusimicrobiota bacterium]
MKTLRAVLAAALACPAPALAQAVAPEPPAEAPVAPAPAAIAPAAGPRAAAASAKKESGIILRTSSALAPLSSNPTPVALPSYSGPSAVGGVPVMPGAPMCGGPEQQELQKLTSLNLIEQQKAVSKLRDVALERDEAAARYNALFEKQKLELSPLEFELKRLQIESNIQDEKFKRELADKRQERERLHIDNDLTREKLAADQLKLEQDKLKADADKLKMDVVIRDMDFQSRKLRMDTELADHKTVALKTDLDLRAKKED